LPHKRFVKQALREKATTYLGTGVSYRQAVRHQGIPILYDDRQDARMATRGSPGLAASTVWRWLSWLGKLGNTIREAHRLIRQKEPRSTLHREPWDVPVGKCRSEQRERVLQQAFECLGVDRLFQKLFGKEIFPRFATAHGWS
jgi:hypothetical protein